MGSLSFRAAVPVFDANVGVGDRHDRPALVQNASGLLEEMDRHGVDRAVIYHLHGESISPVDGNEALTRWADASRCFSMQWMAGPDSDSLRQLKEFRSSGKVQSVRLGTGEGERVPFVDWVYGELLEWLCAERIPLWISLADTSPRDIMLTLRCYPRLVTVLLGAHYTHASVVRPLLRNLPNASLELSRYEPLGEVESLKDEFGEERLIYGSYFPRYAMGPILYYLHNIELTDAELRAICGGNLERILGGSTE